MPRQFYRLQAWWSQLSGRERSLLALLLLSGVMIVFIFGLWQPMRAGLQTAQQQANRQNELFDWVKSRANQIESLRQSGGISATTRQPLNQVIATFGSGVERRTGNGKDVSILFQCIAGGDQRAGAFRCLDDQGAS